MSCERGALSFSEPVIRVAGLLAVFLLAAAVTSGLEQRMPQVPQKEAEQLSPGHELQGSKTEPASNTPAIPVDEIIRQFAAKEAEFKKARDNYTYTQVVRIQEYDLDGRRGGEFQRTSEVIFTPEGKRYERIIWEPPSSLRRVSLSREDLEDLSNIQPFVLTSDDLGKYILDYQGRERVDEIGTYVFRVRPRRIEPDQRYFEGTIWVDDQDLQIVKTYGKAVPDYRRRNEENLFPRFETYRENIDGKYWFPTYTRADDILHFKNDDIRIRMVVRYSDYKQFKSTVRILDPKQVDPDTARPPQRPED